MDFDHIESMAAMQRSEGRTITVTCPDDTVGSMIRGCGHVFEAEPDGEGLIDCPRCGIWFTPPWGTPDESERVKEFLVEWQINLTAASAIDAAKQAAGILSDPDSTATVLIVYGDGEKLVIDVEDPNDPEIIRKEPA